MPKAKGKIGKSSLSKRIGKEAAALIKEEAKFPLKIGQVYQPSPPADNISSGFKKQNKNSKKL